MARLRRKEEPDRIQEEHADSVPEVTPEPGLTLEAAFGKLADAQNLPEQTDQERRDKKLAVGKAGAVCHKLQQGLPLLHIDANGYARAHGSNAEDMRMTRLRYIARSNADVAWILAEYDKATKTEPEQSDE